MKRQIDEIVVHPLVLLAAVDHYNRVARDNDRRVIGCLMGEYFMGRLDISNSFAVPFEEEPNSGLWFVDFDYLEQMFGMFKKINVKELIVGIYSTGPDVKPNDLEIVEQMRRFCDTPMLVVIDIRGEQLELPVQSYCIEEEAAPDGSVKKVFRHLRTVLGATEAEDIGVEHLLRDIRDASISSLTTEVNHKLTALKALEQKLTFVKKYLDLKIQKGVTPTHNILFNLQDIFNLLPNPKLLQKSFTLQSNDSLQAVYLASLTRSLLSLHDLINNRLGDKAAQKQKEQNEKEKKKEAEEKKKKEESKKEEKKEESKEEKKEVAEEKKQEKQ